PPEFTVIDERSAAEALDDATAGLIAAARAGGRPDLAAALAGFARHPPEERFAQLMAVFAEDRGQLAGAPFHGRAAPPAQPPAPSETLTAAFCADDAELAALRAAAAALADSREKSDRRSGAVIARWCEDCSAREALVEDYLDLFLTQEGEIRARLSTRAAQKRARIAL